MTESLEPGILDGVRVIDLTHALAGPLCTHQLHVHGADVIKIEPPGRGDDFRVRPYGRFACINGGKRSLTLNLKHDASRTVLDRLLADADVLVENFRPGVAADFGLDWESLKTRFPRLVYCSISGFGQSGPMKDMPAIEWSVQSVSGIADSYLGRNDDAMDLGIGMLDPCTGYLAFSAILGALYRRTRTGRGARIDAAMLDAAFMLGSNAIAATLLGGPANLGRRPTMARYRTAEGRIFIASLHPRWFEKLCGVIDAPELCRDPRFTSPEAREKNADALVTAIEEKLAARSAGEWERLLVAEGIPAGAARSFEETARGDQVAARGLLERIGTPDEGEIDVVGAAFRLSGEQTGVRGPAPALGEQTDTILASHGFGEEDILQLRAQGAI